MPIDEHYAQQRGCAQKMCKGLQMELTVYKQLRSRQSRRQIILAPDVSGGAGEYGFPMGSVAAQFPRKAQDTIHVLAGEVLDKDHIFFMRLVARRRWLEIKTKGTGLRILKFS